MAPQLSVQTYAVRDALAADLDGTLAKLAEIGLTRVEAFNFVEDPGTLAVALAKNGLSAPTGHAPLLSAELNVDGTIVLAPEQGVVFAAAQVLGMEIVIDPFVEPARWTTRAAIEDTAARINAAAQLAAGYGLRVGYHNHAHEITTRIDGRTAFEVFADLLEPEVVLEVDTYWVHVGGEDAAALLGRLGPRVRALHIKDGPLHDDPIHNDTLDQLPAGQGAVPINRILEAGTDTDYAVIEFDAYRGDIFAGITESYRYLTGLGLS
jgi:sugar phosphate isomerase/epimerase